MALLIVDFGSQLTQLIARRLREKHFYCRICPASASLQSMKAEDPQAIILSGSPASVQDEDLPPVVAELLDLDLPVLGICYGQQVMCAALGGRVDSPEQREYGRSVLRIDCSSPLFKHLQVGDSCDVWMSHADYVEVLPPGFRVVASSANAPAAAIADEAKRRYGIQFHPEASHTQGGTEMLVNFASHAGCQPVWTMPAIKLRLEAEIKDKVGDNHVLCAVSGGVDSTVVAGLLHRVIGSRLACIFIDTGLLRYNEADEVRASFITLGIDLHCVDAGAIFLGRLKGIVDPEEKRKIIGHTFIDVFEAEMVKHPQLAEAGDVLLAQGTLYPDVIESAAHSSGAATIKSHHNVGGLPERMQMDLIEPLRELFKDEVRLLGCRLGLPGELLGRHPFPGPGLAVRIPGEVGAGKVAILQQADRIFLDEIRKNGLYDQIWQAFAVLLPVRSVGVMGDRRTFQQACCLRAVTSHDGMSADVYPFRSTFLTNTAVRIVNEVEGINRVLYDVTSKPPGTIEWE